MGQEISGLHLGIGSVFLVLQSEVVSLEQIQLAAHLLEQDLSEGLRLQEDDQRMRLTVS